MSDLEMQPRKPRPPSIRKTPHGIHLTLTIILLIVTFGTLGWFYVVVWFAHAVLNDISNWLERRRADREMARWKLEFQRWQLRSKDVLGYYPPVIPE